MVKNRENRIVLEDMDGVLFDFEDAIGSALQQNFPGMELADPSSHFYVYKRYSEPKVVEYIKDTQNSEGFFRDLSPLPGAIDQWQILEEHGYAPGICSAPLSDNPYCEQEKLEVIDHYFGAEAADNAFIGKDKQKVEGICLIDDRPGMRNGTTWQRVAFTQPYNSHEQETLRIDGWQDPTILHTLAICAERYDQLIVSRV